MCMVKVNHLNILTFVVIFLCNPACICDSGYCDILFLYTGLYFK